MRGFRLSALLIVACWVFVGIASAEETPKYKPRWWAKYERLRQTRVTGGVGGSSLTIGDNVDVSNECGPQSETFITLAASQPAILAAGSNEIFRLPMRGYFSSDGGTTWGGVDVPLPPPRQGTHNTRFGSDPSLAFDSGGTLFYSYIVVYFGNGSGIDGTAVAVARSDDGGQTYPALTVFSFETGSNHFNDKPMITTDANPGSSFRDTVYVAWDAAAGGSTSGGIRIGRSSDHGATFSVTRADDPSGPSNAIGAMPFVGPNGEVYVAWNDIKANAIVFNRSFDGGITWDRQTVISPKTIEHDIGIPAESVRGALVYPACDADRSTGPRRGRLYCAWMDLTGAGTTDILVSVSDDRGAHWSPPAPVSDQLPFLVDRFNQWLSVDPVTGDVNVAFYDTRNDTTGFRFETDYFFSQSTDGGASWLSPNVRVSTASSNEHDCDGLFPCPGINYGNQQGDYAGLVSFGGVSHAIWTDSRLQLEPLSGCSRGLAMEEVFTARVQIE